MSFFSGFDGDIPDARRAAHARSPAAAFSNGYTGEVRENLVNLIFQTSEIFLLLHHLGNSHTHMYHMSLNIFISQFDVNTFVYVFKGVAYIQI